MKNPYTAKLETELADLIRRRVALRNILKRAGCGMGSGDAYDRRQGVETAARELKFLQREYERLHHELGRPLPGAGSVKLDAAWRSRPVVRSAVSYAHYLPRRTVGGR